MVFAWVASARAVMAPESSWLSLAAEEVVGVAGRVAVTVGVAWSGMAVE